MRREYYVLWLDDKIQTDTSLNKRIIEKIEEHIKNDLAFEPRIVKENEINRALSYCNASPQTQRIDLFVSDFNLVGDDNGFNFLKNVRSNNYKQDLILYSNNSVEEITASVIQHIEAENDLDVFSRFTFQSLNDRDEFINTVNQIIDLNIEKWQELNALRGLYLSEISQIEMTIKEKIKATADLSMVNAIFQNNSTNGSIDSQIESKLKKLINNVTDAKLKKISFSEIKDLIVEDSNILHTEWTEIAEIRNSLAHVREDQDTLGRYICSCKDNTKKFYENDIIRYRKKLFEFLDNVENKLNNLGL